MSANYTYPTAAAFFQIGQDLAERGEKDRLGLQIFPTVTKETFNVRWSQADNYHGLMQMRGLDGLPPRPLTRTGDKTYVYEPGVYGEHTRIEESELLRRAIPGHPEIRIPLDDLIMRDSRLLTGRRLDRMEANVFQLMLTGTLSIPMPGPAGPVTYTDSYPIQTYFATIPWNLLSTATPLANMQGMQQLSVGHGVDFGVGAILAVNQVQANRMLNNTNASDFGGKRDMYGATLNNLTLFNNYFQAQNLPKVVVYDEGYQILPLSGAITSASTQFRKFIPDGTGILIGKRKDGSNVGEWQQTINAMNPGYAAGPYNLIKDFAQGVNAPKEIPPRVEVHHGVNGGPAILFPSAIVACTL